MKIDKTVLKETKYIASFVLVLSVLMQAVFLIIAKWHYTVLLGNVWGAAAAVANFLGMGIGVQKAVTQEEKEARQTLKTSQTLRFFALFVFGLIGVLVPFFNSVAALLPLLFPRIAIALRPVIDKKTSGK